MNPESILQADILDIIFDGRNKEYGAYTLRKNYDRRMCKAMFAVTLFAASMFMMNYWNVPKKEKLPGGRVMVIDPVVISPPPPDPPPPVKPPKQKMATTENPGFVLTNDPEPDTMPTVEDLDKNVRIGLKREIGSPFISDMPPPDHADEPGDAKDTEDRPEATDPIEIMPEFPGGQTAFTRFLSKNLRVPENSLEPGQKIKIIVRFIVGREGEIFAIEFIKTNGEVFEQEVLRVLRKMPRWKPGVQNGEKVQVYFNLPIIFDAPEE